MLLLLPLGDSETLDDAKSVVLNRAIPVVAVVYLRDLGLCPSVAIFSLPGALRMSTALLGCFVLLPGLPFLL